jgi:phosphoribosylformylglycinamidine synthase subunit PurS
VTARVFVTLKKTVLDPQGKAVQEALSRLGFSEVADVRVGKYLELRLEAGDPVRARERVAEMCKKLLANPVIEEFRFEIGE